MQESFLESFTMRNKKFKAKQLAVSPPQGYQEMAVKFQDWLMRYLPYIDVKCN